MIIAIWGTGNIYQKYKKYLNVEVGCFIDNDRSKHGKYIDGIKVFSPDETDYEKYTYILIMAASYREIEAQLRGMGILEEKIVSYVQFVDICNAQMLVHKTGEDVEFTKWLQKESEEKRALICVHDMSYTGVPVTGLNLSKLLAKMGYSVLFSSLREGPLRRELDKSNISYVDDLDIFYTSKYFFDEIKNFDLIIVCTLVLANFIKIVQKSNMPIMWWIHESLNEFYENIKFPQLSPNVKVFAGGIRVTDALLRYYNWKDVDQLLYFIPDCKRTDKKMKADDTFVLAIVGAVSVRKGQDILLDALELLDRQQRKRLVVLMVGDVIKFELDFGDMIQHRLCDFPEVKKYGYVDQEELEKIYENIDILVCPSRDDPMPLVVTQAMMHSKTCIISDHVGQKEYIVNGESGFVFQDENIYELANIFNEIVRQKYDLNIIGKGARDIYERNFSEMKMKEEMNRIISHLMS